MDRLTSAERWTAAAIALATVAVVALVAWPLESSAGAVAFDAVVFGGLSAAALVTVYVDRRQSARRADRCPRCGLRGQGRAPRCARCGYDLVERPRYACSEQHEVTREPGVCSCGRRLHPLPPPRHGVGVRTAVAVGAWLLAFLLGTGLLLSLTS